MPYTPKQVKFFRAVEHGMKPKSGKGPSPSQAKKMLNEVGGKATRPPVRTKKKGK